MKITPLGDSALTVRVAEDSEGTSRELLREVLATKEAIERAGISGVVECTSSYASVTIFFDPARVPTPENSPAAITQWFEERITAAIGKPRGKNRPLHRSQSVEIPMCCDREVALDLADVARGAGVTEDEVVALFCATEFQVVCIGFTPGFPYLSGLPEKLATPRRSVPRTRIPAGSVAIGGGQAGIYPMISPGGWNVIGRTPLALFSPSQNPPALLAAGDLVRFRDITRAEFEALDESESRASSCT
jgi:inhibitor of KinA